MTDITLFQRFRSALARGRSALYTQDTELARDAKYVLHYTPFEYENVTADLVVVGMTPGPSQLQLCYDEYPLLAAQGQGDLEILAHLKRHGAFGGDTMRPRLIDQLEHFAVAQRLGHAHADAFWNSGAHSFHATSVVPHAAFHAQRKNADGSPVMFSGSFAHVLANPVLRRCFEHHFLAQLRRMKPNAGYIGLGTTPKAALRHAVREGILAKEQVLGTFAHPSTNGGNRVPYFLRQVALADLHPLNPVRKSAAEYDEDYAEMARNVNPWRPLPATV